MDFGIRYTDKSKDALLVLIVDNWKGSPFFAKVKFKDGQERTITLPQGDYGEVKTGLDDDLWKQKRLCASCPYKNKSLTP